MFSMYNNQQLQQQIAQPNAASALKQTDERISFEADVREYQHPPVVVKPVMKKRVSERYQDVDSLDKLTTKQAS